VGIPVKAVTSSRELSQIYIVSRSRLALAWLCVGCGGWEVGEADVRGVNHRSVQWLTKNKFHLSR